MRRVKINGRGEEKKNGGNEVRKKWKRTGKVGKKGRRDEGGRVLGRGERDVERREEEEKNG